MLSAACPFARSLALLALLDLAVGLFLATDVHSKSILSLVRAVIVRKLKSLTGSAADEVKVRRKKTDGTNWLVPRK